MTQENNFTSLNLRLSRDIALKLIALYMILGCVLRICLMCNPLTDLTGVSVFTVAGILFAGVLNDMFTAVVLLFPLWAFMISAGTWRFDKPRCYVFFGLLVAVWLALTLFPGKLAEFNHALYRLIRQVLLYWIAVFALRAFIPALRARWMQAWMCIILVLYSGVMVFNFIGEWLFWDEFGVRYNFIAVDYLIYTTEVVGNICESYPMGWIGGGIVVVSLAVAWLLFRKNVRNFTTLHSGKWRLKASVCYLGALALSLVMLPLMSRLQSSPNVFVNELEASGPYSFYKAFFSNELDFNRFYITNPPEVVDALTAGVTSPPVVCDSVSEIYPNIILVTMESMSADYMRHFGDTCSLTPNLDSLYTRSVAFDNMFATGNRTVRGLEAVTLSRPPSPGESIIKRPCNTGYPSIADVLREKGYSLSYVYGGDSYFDNMESFFGGNGYEIIDNGNFTPSEVNFKTVWGICDGDVFSRVIREADSRSASAKPFFIHIMTTSNHRPYTYPEGKISIPPSAKKRAGGVMYSDYALGEFVRTAASRPWMDSTVIVVLADHCAASAGSVDLPLENYHIPALIYSPSLFTPRIVPAVSSQIDLMPTLFAMLGWTYSTPLYGKNALADDYRSRAFVATYQDMGYLEGDTLTVLSPGKKTRQFVITPQPSNPYALTPLDNPSANALAKAVSIYQKASLPPPHK